MKQNLQKLWPRQTWSDHINDERPDDVLRILDGIYDLIRAEPRVNEAGIDDEMWSNSFESGLIILRALFRKTQSIDDAMNINQRLANRLLIEYDNIDGLPLSESYQYWSLSKVLLPSTSENAFDLSVNCEKLTDSKIE